MIGDRISYFAPRVDFLDLLLSSDPFEPNNQPHRRLPRTQDAGDDRRFGFVVHMGSGTQLNQKTAGFQELEHTADWELHVWAPALAALFEQAALGMYRLMGTRLHPAAVSVREVDLEAEDPESLLVTFLAELLFMGEQEALGFDQFDLKIQDLHLLGRMTGGPITAQEKEIKAVTYHNLELRQTEEGFAINIVFDV